MLFTVISIGRNSRLSTSGSAITLRARPKKRFQQTDFAKRTSLKREISADRTRRKSALRHSNGFQLRQQVLLLPPCDRFVGDSRQRLRQLGRRNRRHEPRRRVGLQAPVPISHIAGERLKFGACGFNVDVQSQRSCFRRVVDLIDLAACTPQRKRQCPHADCQSAYRYRYCAQQG